MTQTDTFLAAAGTINLLWRGKYADDSEPPEGRESEVVFPLIGWHIADGIWFPVAWLQDQSEALDFGSEQPVTNGFEVVRIDPQ